MDRAAATVRQGRATRLFGMCPHLLDQRRLLPVLRIGAPLEFFLRIRIGISQLLLLFDPSLGPRMCACLCHSFASGTSLDCLIVPLALQVYNSAFVPPGPDLTICKLCTHQLADIGIAELVADVASHGCCLYKVALLPNIKLVHSHDAALKKLPGHLPGCTPAVELRGRPRPDSPPQKFASRVNGVPTGVQWALAAAPASCAARELLLLMLCSAAEFNACPSKVVEGRCHTATPMSPTEQD